MNTTAYLKLVARWVAFVGGVFLLLTPVLIFSMAVAGYAGRDEMQFMARWAVGSAGFLFVGLIAECMLRRRPR